MRHFLHNLGVIIYAFISLFSGCLAIAYPFIHGMKDCPNWLAWVVYPVFLITMALHEQFLKQIDVINKE